MEIKRTAAAGVLLTLDGKNVLLDGVSREVKPYPATPENIRQELLRTKLDAVAITHHHLDHYDASFVSEYVKNTAGPLVGPADIQITDFGSLEIQPVKSRHIGKMEDINHTSFILRGSQCIWFTGDSSPLQWQGREELPKPDVLIAPYAYAIGTGWKITKVLAPKVLVLLHLPDRLDDTYGLWDAVEQAVQGEREIQILIPKMGETVQI